MREMFLLNWLRFVSEWFVKFQKQRCEVMKNPVICIECNNKVVNHYKSYFCEDCLPKFYGEPRKDEKKFENIEGKNEKV